MSKFSLHKRRETARLRDYGKPACLEVPKSRVPKSKNKMNNYLNNKTS